MILTSTFIHSIIIGTLTSKQKDSKSLFKYVSSMSKKMASLLKYVSSMRFLSSIAFAFHLSIKVMWPVETPWFIAALSMIPLVEVCMVLLIIGYSFTINERLPSIRLRSRI